MQIAFPEALVTVTEERKCPKSQSELLFPGNKSEALQTWLSAWEQALVSSGPETNKKGLDLRLKTNRLMPLLYPEDVTGMGHAIKGFP